MIQQNKISHDSGKKIMSLIFTGDTREARAIAEEEKMIVQDIPIDLYTQTAEELVESNPGIAKAIKEKGQQGKIMWFVGQMMKNMSKQTGGGGVKSELAKEAIIQALGLPGYRDKTKK
jgi:aspartyl-tRNA(Asn)/glutamyl-tRNA(Gln) amidotransferase subunit B